MPSLTESHAKTRTQKGNDTGIPQLSCVLCRERKVRCDKAHPHCTNCVKAGMACVPVYRKRYSRGRHTAPRNVVRQAKGTAAGAEAVPRQMDEDDLQDRVRRLECLINDITHERKDGNGLFKDTRVSQTPQSSLLFGPDPNASQHERGNVNTSTDSESRPKTDLKHDFWTDLVKKVRRFPCYCPLGPLLAFQSIDHHIDC